MKIVRKIVVFALLPLIVALFVALYVVSIGFNKLSFNDAFMASHDFSAYYHNNYEDAKIEFRNVSRKASTEFRNVEISQLEVPSAEGHELAVDFLYIPAQKEKRNLLVLISGVHGVESFVGHAVQQMFMEHYADPVLLANTGLLLIHGLNPYGFINTRRVTENNVDLNRNSPSTPDLYKTVNEGYFMIYNFVNPKGEVKRMSFSNRFFFVKAINEIRKASLPVLRQAVLQGQYQYSEGLYFGGKQPEPQIAALESLITSWTAPYEKILAIDLHTGYGERGKLHLFPNPLEEPQRTLLTELFDGYEIDWGDSDDFYTVTGDFVGFIGALNSGKEYYPMLFEYGTLNSQTTMGSLKSIHIMILENQGHHYGYASAKDSIRVKNDFREMYYPSSKPWRNYIMQQTMKVFDDVLPRFVN